MIVHDAVDREYVVTADSFGCLICGRTQRLTDIYNHLICWGCCKVLATLPSNDRAEIIEEAKIKQEWINKEYDEVSE